MKSNKSQLCAAIKMAHARQRSRKLSTNFPLGLSTQVWLQSMVRFRFLRVRFKLEALLAYIVEHRMQNRSTAILACPYVPGAHFCIAKVAQDIAACQAAETFLHAHSLELAPTHAWGSWKRIFGGLLFGAILRQELPLGWPGLHCNPIALLCELHLPRTASLSGEPQTLPVEINTHESTACGATCAAA